MVMHTSHNAPIYAADLFCGSGGTSTGLLKAAKSLKRNVRLVAVNHWDIAISTHSANHPGVKHYNSDLKDVDPRAVVPTGSLRLLVASPECTHFSKARGGKPMSKQSRASIKYVLKWVSSLDVEDVLIENVPDFMTWGPLHAKCTCGAGPDIKKKHDKTCKYQTPIQSRKGEYFNRFIAKLRQLGYTVAYRVLNAANYGAPTTRKRLFIQARKRRPVRWPAPTHSEVGADMFEVLPRWKSARDHVIDWSIKGTSIYDPKTGKPRLKPNTMRRIMIGLERFAGLPFVIGQQSGAMARSVEMPIPTISTAGAIALIEPFLIEYYGTGTVRSIDTPIPTITTKARFGLAQPITIEHDGVAYILDILYRMLTPRELARGQSFKNNYKLFGTREEIIKQIGNSVPPDIAEALCFTMLEDTPYN